MEESSASKIARQEAFFKQLVFMDATRKISGNPIFSSGMCSSVADQHGYYFYNHILKDSTKYKNFLDYMQQKFSPDKIDNVFDFMDHLFFTMYFENTGSTENSEFQDYFIIENNEQMTEKLAKLFQHGSFFVFVLEKHAMSCGKETIEGVDYYIVCDSNESEIRYCNFDELCGKIKHYIAKYGAVDAQNEQKQDVQVIDFQLYKDRLHRYLEIGLIDRDDNLAIDVLNDKHCKEAKRNVRQLFRLLFKQERTEEETKLIVKIFAKFNPVLQQKLKEYIFYFNEEDKQNSPIEGIKPKYVPSITITDKLSGSKYSFHTKEVQFEGTLLKMPNQFNEFKKYFQNTDHKLAIKSLENQLQKSPVSVDFYELPLVLFSKHCFATVLKMLQEKNITTITISDFMISYGKLQSLVELEAGTKYNIRTSSGAIYEFSKEEIKKFLEYWKEAGTQRLLSDIIIEYSMMQEIVNSNTLNVRGKVSDYGSNKALETLQYANQEVTFKINEESLLSKFKEEIFLYEIIKVGVVKTIRYDYNSINQEHLEQLQKILENNTNIKTIIIPKISAKDGAKCNKEADLLLKIIDSCSSLSVVQIDGVKLSIEQAKYTLNKLKHVNIINAAKIEEELELFKFEQFFNNYENKETKITIPIEKITEKGSANIAKCLLRNTQLEYVYVYNVKLTVAEAEYVLNEITDAKQINLSNIYKKLETFKYNLAFQETTSNQRYRLEINGEIINKYGLKNVVDFIDNKCDVVIIEGVILSPYEAAHVLHKFPDIEDATFPKIQAEIAIYRFGLLLQNPPTQETPINLTDGIIKFYGEARVAEFIDANPNLKPINIAGKKVSKEEAVFILQA